MVIMASGIAHGHARTHDDDSGVVQDGSRSPNDRLTETCSLGVLCTCSSLIFDIRVMIN